tara:strand:- start:5718 stop:9350 length:3633 start_codon:yes stop_codon:yes gene_type:complete
MAETHNSLNTILKQFLQLNTNSLEIFERINEAITSDLKTVDVDIFEQDGTLKKLTIPSFGYLKNEISRLDENVKALSGIGDSNTNVRLADGSFRRVLISKIKTPGNTLTTLGNPSTFESKTNSFFEDFLNPLLFITVDVSGQIPSDTERVNAARYLLNLDTDTKRRYWEDNISGRSDLSHSQFLKDIVLQNISATEDEELRDMPPRKTRYKGSFNVIRIADEDFTETINEIEITRRRILYTFNKLTYSDDTLDLSDTLDLKIGETILVNKEPFNTRYRVKSIDSSTLQVELELIEGFLPIEIGTNILKIHRDIDDTVFIEIPCGLDEYTVTFIKPIDPVSKVIADDWSPGIAYYSNSLTISADGETQTLETYYKNQVADFGLFIKSFANDRIPPSVYAETPDAPVLSSSSFKVIQINKHITDSKAFTKLQRLHNQKNRLITSLKRNDSAIESMRSTLATKRYKGSIERDNDKQQLFALVESRAANAEQFASIVRDITTTSADDDLQTVKPKYRVVGFWPFPSGKASRYTATQEVVQFKVQYRYVSNTGNANQPEQVTFEDNGVNRIGSITNWQEFLTNPRNRAKDAKGNFQWQIEAVEDADSINSNQLDIAINQGEKIEIRIKSISEAGYPSNPAESDYSKVTVIEFPDSLIQDDKVSEIITQNEKDLVRVKLQDELTSQGVSVHVSGSFTTNENYFAHPATEIASGFLSAEQTPVTLFDKLQEMSQKLEEFEAILTNIKGDLVVKILNEDGVENTITNGSFNEFFAGYYDSEVDALTVKKGAIISKTFFLIIENDAATPLELVGRIYGDRTLKAYNSGGKFGDAILTGTEHVFASDSYYTQRGKYDYVPLLYTNSDVTAQSTFDYVNDTPHQSAQKRNQLVYTKYKSVSGNEEFYVDYDNDSPASTIAGVDDAEYSWSGASFTSSGNTADYVWNGNYDAGSNDAQVMSIPADYNNRIYIHSTHPDVVKGKRSSTVMSYIAVNAKTAGLTSDVTNGKKQTGFFYDSNAPAADPASTTYVGGFGNATSLVGKSYTSNQPIGRTIKMAFEPNDQYLLGGKSVGAYLFLAPENEKSLNVNGNDALSLKTVEFGFSKAISIPIIFQYRMTDYKGVGTTGLGFIGGDKSETIQDLTYAKRMGFDIKTSAAMDEAEFHFDIEVFAKYRSKKLSADKVPTKDINLALADLTKELSDKVVPTVKERTRRGRRITRTNR